MLDEYYQIGTDNSLKAILIYSCIIDIAVTISYKCSVVSETAQK